MVKQRLPHEDGEEGSRMGKAFQMDGIGNFVLKTKAMYLRNRKKTRGQG